MIEEDNENAVLNLYLFFTLFYFGLNFTSRVLCITDCKFPIEVSYSKSQFILQVFFYFLFFVFNFNFYFYAI
jgi:hypothetical protein